MFYQKRNFSGAKKISSSLLTLEYTLGLLFHFCYLTYIMERESCLVDPGVYKSVNPKLFNIVSYLILDPREDEVNLKGFQNRVCGLYSGTNQSLFTIVTGICRHIFCVWQLLKSKLSHPNQTSNLSTAGCNAPQDSHYISFRLTMRLLVAGLKKVSRS